MTDKEKDASALAGQEASAHDINVTSPEIIPQPAAQAQAPTTKKGKSSRFRGDKRKNSIGINSKVYSLALKFYLEQLPNGEQYFIQQIKLSDKSYVQIIAIKHDRDTVTDGIWEEANVKPHWHVIIRLVDKKSRVRVGTLLKDLGIEFRRGLDDKLWEGHGVETVGNFAGYTMYLTHETEEAIRDGKELYAVSELVSNLSEDEIEQVRQGYIKVSAKRKLTEEERISLDKEAFNLGYSMGNFDDWYNQQPFNVRADAKMKVIRESYDRGVATCITENSHIVRLCVFIQGQPNTGKTYAAERALDGKRVFKIGGGGTGKLDKLRPDHEAIIVDDDICPNLLNMTDNEICYAYKRNKNNPPWAGKYFVVTSNLCFGEWVEMCGIKMRDTLGRVTAHNSAMISRFFVCRLEEENGINHLALTCPSKRGSVEEQQERLSEFIRFKEKFDSVIATYQPKMNVVDYSSVIEPRRN